MRGCLASGSTERGLCLSHAEEFVITRTGDGNTAVRSNVVTFLSSPDRTPERLKQKDQKKQPFSAEASVQLTRWIVPGAVAGGFPKHEPTASAEHMSQRVSGFKAEQGSPVWTRRVFIRG